MGSVDLYGYVRPYQSLTACGATARHKAAQYLCRPPNLLAALWPLLDRRARVIENRLMAKTKKATHKPSLPFPSAADAFHQGGNWLWIPLRKELRDITTKPEEVRQRFIRTLVEHYGYALKPEPSAP